MRIKAVLSQSRRDLQVLYECQACGAEKESYGYDDANFYNNVVPSMKCESCGAVGGPDESRTPTVPAWVTM